MSWYQSNHVLGLASQFISMNCVIFSLCGTASEAQFNKSTGWSSNVHVMRGWGN